MTAIRPSERNSGPVERDVATESPDETRRVASQVGIAASTLLVAGGGKLVRELYDHMSALARRIAAGDAAGARTALADARATLVRSCPVTGWRRVRVRPTSLSAEALDRAEAWVRAARGDDARPR